MRTRSCKNIAVHRRKVGATSSKCTKPQQKPQQQKQQRRQPKRQTIREQMHQTTRVTRHSKTKFTDLNNDCIEEILRRLPAVELCKFTVLSKRLKAIAEEMFRRLYSLKTITFKPTETCSTEFGSKITRLFMEAFGAYMQQIQIIGTESGAEKRMERKMLSAIGEYCGPNLQCINLVRLDLNDVTVPLLAKTLSTVPQMTLDGCRVAHRAIDVYELLLKKCRHLRTLNIIQCDTFDHATWLRHRYSTIQTVQVLRATFRQHDVDEFFRLNSHMRDVWFNVRMPTLTHRYDNEKLQRFLLINGFDEGKYCLRFLNTYTKIVVKSLALGHNLLNDEKCAAIAQMTDIRELKLIKPTFICSEFVSHLSKGLENLATIFLSGAMFTFQVLQDVLSNFPRLEFLYLHNTAFDAISMQEFAQLIEARRRSSTISTENYPLTIIVGRCTPVYARTMWRKFKHNKNIKVITMQMAEFQSHFYLAD